MIKVINWNIACGADGYHECKNLDQMIKIMSDLKPDFLFLQEIDQNLKRSGNRDIPKLIAQALNYDFVFAKPDTETSGKGGMGNTIISKHKLFSKKSYDIGPHVKNPNWETEDRCLSFAQTKVKNKTISLFSTHLASSMYPSQIRHIQCENIMNFFKKHKSDGILGGGDFNAYKESSDLLPVSKKLKEYTGDIGPTCSLKEDEDLIFEIDHLYGKGFQRHSCKVFKYPELSDHCLVFTTLKENF